MSSLKLTLRHGDVESVIDEVSSSIDSICEITGCRMEWGDPTPETVSWEFYFKNENQEECTRSMLLDLVHDFPYNLSLK